MIQDKSTNFRQKFTEHAAVTTYLQNMPLLPHICGPHTKPSVIVGIAYGRLPAELQRDKHRFSTVHKYTATVDIDYYDARGLHPIPFFQQGLD
jgi:hypothetical protein